ncbi:rRNA-binding ribosome biosynthesis protein utp25 [Podila humilis]|nr:rRNA-binding ribosome biosynthesis protein utp25 [Podila humilis]
MARGGKRGGGRGGGKSLAGGRGKDDSKKPKVSGRGTTTTSAPDSKAPKKFGQLSRKERDMMEEYGELVPQDFDEDETDRVGSFRKVVNESDLDYQSALKRDRDLESDEEVEEDEYKLDRPSAFNKLVGILKKTSKRQDEWKKRKLEEEGLEDMEEEEEADVEEEVVTLTEAERKELIKKHGKGYLKALEGDDEDSASDDEEVEHGGDEAPAAGEDEPESSADEDDVKALAQEDHSDDEDSDEEEIFQNSEDNFDRHFSDLVTPSLAAKVAVVELAGAKWKSMSYEDSVLKRVEKFDTDNVEGQLSDEKKKNKSHDLESLMVVVDVKQRIQSHWADVNKSVQEHDSTKLFTPLQEALVEPINEYRDVLYTNRTMKNAKEIRNLYALHAMNHVYKTRDRVLRNTAKLQRHQQNPNSSEAIPEFRDQGFTRPKVLIILPFKNSVVDVVESLIALSGSTQQDNKKRFFDEFGAEEEEEDPKNADRPADFVETFRGNIDDHFRVGIKFTRKTLKLYSDFYSADLILASPLGLKTVIGAEGDKKRDFDFLASIELVIVDQADDMLMQNWDHLETIFELMNLIPKNAHGCDFSRVRNWSLDGRAKYVRQTLMFSSFLTPEINALFKKFSKNVAGKMKITQAYENGSIVDVVPLVQQNFNRIETRALSQVDESRFQYFIQTTLPQLRRSAVTQTHTMIYVPSYFDFVRLRNYFTENKYSFAAICEYTSNANVSRARSSFFHGEVSFLLYTERFHFFRRYNIRGTFHLAFYGLPEHSQFYPEMLNLLALPAGKEKSRSKHAAAAGLEDRAMSCTALFTKYDLLKLQRITLLEELDQYIEVLERAASWMEINNLQQWIPGTFRQDEARYHIQTAIKNKTSYVVIHAPTSTIAAIFALNYEDPFDEMLWAHYAKDWKDAIYVHRLVVESEFQGRGIVPKILEFTESLVEQEGKHYLRNAPRIPLWPTFPGGSDIASPESAYHSEHSSRLASASTRFSTNRPTFCFCAFILSSAALGLQDRLDSTHQLLKSNHKQQHTDPRLSKRPLKMRQINENANPGFATPRAPKTPPSTPRRTVPQPCQYKAPIVYQYTYYYPGNMPLIITAGHGGSVIPGKSTARPMTHRFTPLPDLGSPSLDAFSVASFSAPIEGTDPESNATIPWMPERDQSKGGNFKNDLNTHLIALNLADSVAQIVNREVTPSGLKRPSSSSQHGMSVRNQRDDDTQQEICDTDPPGAFSPTAGVSTRTPPSQTYIPTKEPLYPHVVVFRVRRLFVDVNRNITGENAVAEGNPNSEAAWKEYHGVIEHVQMLITQTQQKSPTTTATQSLSSNKEPWPRKKTLSPTQVYPDAPGSGLLLDIHGHAHATNLIEVGYLLDGATLAQDDQQLDNNSAVIVQKSSVRSLLENIVILNGSKSDHSSKVSASQSRRIAFSSFLRGQFDSLGGRFQAQGLGTVPSPENPAPCDECTYFFGGYTTQEHGSRSKSFSAMDAIQLELPKVLRFVDAEEGREIGMRLGQAVTEFMAQYYGLWWPTQNMHWKSGHASTTMVSRDEQEGVSVGPWPLDPQTAARQLTFKLRSIKEQQQKAAALAMLNSDGNQSGDSDAEDDVMESSSLSSSPKISTDSTMAHNEASAASGSVGVKRQTSRL